MIAAAKRAGKFGGIGIIPGLLGANTENGIPEVF